MTTQNKLTFSFVCGITLLLLAELFLSSHTALAGSHRIFEMRTYTTHSGKLDDLHDRFKNHTNSLFVKHGMHLIGYWTPTEMPKSENTLIYILSYPNPAARKKSWEAFLADPVWQDAFKNSIRNGRLVKEISYTFLNATEYSPIQ
ncbi:MAG: NIPSNAP family protein [Solibacterales bacterium]|nr:NIPSNAP family protein [Bryobacterales bacterium]|tara:strand:- start:1119 stop:1553 length:435 start_codon:yes stop_codon:yes gene_type:complete